ncbi:hypothetical protein TNCV_1128101 [Trichonephila clavipes]|nr:hypothetical protein TNCV_1128101 [Trichonephila clavipes]
MPPVWRGQIEAHEVHRGKGLDVRLSIAVALSTIQVTVRFGSVHVCAESMLYNLLLLQTVNGNPNLPVPSRFNSGHNSLVVMVTNSLPMLFLSSRRITWSVAKSPRVAEQYATLIFTHSPLLNSAGQVVKAKDSWSACDEFEPSTARDPPRKMGPMHVKSANAQTSLSNDLFSVWFGNSSKRSSSKAKIRRIGPKRDCRVPDFHKRILFSDEAHFWLNGYVYKQNCRIWSEANPQVYVETPLHPEKLIVWCALWAGGILLQKR